MIGKVAVTILGAAIASFAASAQPSADQPGIIAAVTQCRARAEPADRLACYDAAVGRLADATAKRDIVVMDKQEVLQTRRTLFGFSLPSLPFLRKDDGSDDTAEMRELETTVRTVRPAGVGLWTLVLAEGGTWQTTEASRRVNPQSGQSIHIKSGPLGGYMANIDGSRAVRVRRTG